MKGILWLAVVGLLALFAAAAEADTTGFPGGTLDVLWADEATLSLRVVLDAPVAQTGSAALMWVVTVQASRFADGITSWQLHLSPTYASIVVIPNDFLTTQRFTLEQLRVEVAASDPGRFLSLRIPRSGPIPELVAPGDEIEVHALWIQQAPVVVVTVPWPEVLPPSLAGSGGATSQMLPAQEAYAIGAVIRHQFAIVDPETGEPVPWGAATIALVRIREGQADEIIRYLYREPDPATGIVTYEFDTLNLAPGIYEIIVWATPTGLTVRHRLRLVPADS
jgi:hypothetical protein